MTYRLIHADCLDALREMPEASVHAIVTDPPYGLEFMGKDWDSFGQQRDPRTAGRVGAGAVASGKALKEDGGMTGVRVAFGGKRPTTWRCDKCNKRDQFRVHSTRFPGCDGTWRLEVIDPQGPAPLLGFQKWCETWAVEALRVLTPGGHLLAFGGTRTYHRMTVALEDAGFEIRDCLMWLYGSGFPKSLDVSKAIDKASGVDTGSDERWVPTAHPVTGPYKTASGHSDKIGQVGPGLRHLYAPATPDAERWQGWGTALKPAYEPIVLARKPLSGTVAQTVLEHGTGAINIDGCRIGTDGGTQRATNPKHLGRSDMTDFTRGNFGVEPLNAGRWPANILFDEEAAAMLDEQSGVSKSQGGRIGKKAHGAVAIGGAGTYEAGDPGYGDTGGASRFFYVAKASRKERNAGLGGLPIRRPDERTETGMRTFDEKGVQPQQNFHPTVKPVALMRYLIRLITPPGGTVLDPFLGSGTTGVAAVAEGVEFIGIEREADYIEIARRRIAHAEQLQDEAEPSLFDSETA